MLVILRIVVQARVTLETAHRVVAHVGLVVLCQHLLFRVHFGGGIESLLNFLSLDQVLTF